MPKVGDVLSHHEMCATEGRMLQQGMLFSAGRTHSVILMSRRKNAPYPDRMDEEGRRLYYIGHDAYGNPKKLEIDQPLVTERGTLTQNGLFFKAAKDFHHNGRASIVRVYEKIGHGIWVFNGVFRLAGATYEGDGRRKVCVFELELIETASEIETEEERTDVSPGRLIPTES